MFLTVQICVIFTPKLLVLLVLLVTVSLAQEDVFPSVCLLAALHKRPELVFWASFDSVKVLEAIPIGIWILFKGFFGTFCHFGC